MKLVKCINKGAGEYLTIGKLYEVKRVVNQTNSKWLSEFGEQMFIEVLNDKGVSLLFNMTGDKPNFIDIEEDRNNKLNQLGI
jgi:hypothetical protein